MLNFEKGAWNEFSSDTEKLEPVSKLMSISKLVLHKHTQTLTERRAETIREVQASYHVRQVWFC